MRSSSPKRSCTVSPWSSGCSTPERSSRARIRCHRRRSTRDRSAPTTRQVHGRCTSARTRRASSRGEWSPTESTLVFDATPELSVPDMGTNTAKVTGFTDCGRAIYVSVHTDLYRRNDGPLHSGHRRWQRVYKAPPVGPENSGIRGLSCVQHAGSDSILFSTEGNGEVWRGIDDLPDSQLGPAAPDLVPTCRSSPRRPPFQKC